MYSYMLDFCLHVYVYMGMSTRTSVCVNAICMHWVCMSAIYVRILKTDVHLYIPLYITICTAVCADV